MLIVEKNRRDHTNLGNDPRVSLDPHKLYEEQYNKVKASATGVGKLVFGFIPFSIIRSFALAIDPLKKFRALPIKISPVSRTRWRERTSVLDKRTYKLIRSRQNYQSFIWATQGGPPGFFCYSPPILQPTSGITVMDSGINAVPVQPYSATVTKDTTTRTRPAGSELGEFLHFKYELLSPPLNISYTRSSRISLSMTCNNQVDWTDDYFYTQDTGPGGTMSKAALDALQTSEIAELETLMQKKVLGMLARTVPMSRRYTAFRNVIELKDLPRSILSLKRAIEAFHRAIDILPMNARHNIRRYINRRLPKDIPSEYVSYHFGWKQIINDVMDLLDKPVRAAKEVNRLMRRSGKPTTFRSNSKIAGKTTDAPAFIYSAPWGAQESITTTTEHRRQHEFRLVLNATFDFPNVGVPKFKRDLFLHKIGVTPMPTDLYNLIPWSWLVDWFTGLGNYVEAIDIINTDKSLFNWGLFTGITKGEITTTRRFKVRHIRDGKTDNVSFSNVTETWVTHQSVLKYTLHLRKNVTSAYGVKTILEPGSLSTYQQSILAAILASRRK